MRKDRPAPTLAEALAYLKNRYDGKRVQLKLPEAMVGDFVIQPRLSCLSPQTLERFRKVAAGVTIDEIGREPTATVLSPAQSAPSLDFLAAALPTGLMAIAAKTPGLDRILLPEFLRSDALCHLAQNAANIASDSGFFNGHYCYLAMIKGRALRGWHVDIAGITDSWLRGESRLSGELLVGQASGATTMFCNQSRDVNATIRQQILDDFPEGAPLKIKQPAQQILEGAWSPLPGLTYAFTSCDQHNSPEPSGRRTGLRRGAFMAFFFSQAGYPSAVTLSKELHMAETSRRLNGFRLVR